MEGKIIKIDTDIYVRVDDDDQANEAFDLIQLEGRNVLANSFPAGEVLQVNTTDWSEVNEEQARAAELID